jgi:hypothetical protein
LRGKELEDLAFFLNSVTSDMTAAQWKKFCKAAKKRGLLSDPFVNPSFTERLTLREAQDLRTEIARDLSYRDKNPDAPMASLLGSLDGLELRTRYRCPPLRLYGKARPGQIILKVGKNRFVPRMYPEARTPKELLYVTLGAAFMDGTLSRLKTCLHCKQWMVGKNAGRKFCPSGCKDAFHYEQRSEVDYFSQYQRERRAAFRSARSAARH